MTLPSTMTDRLRDWYEFEKDCNQHVLRMLKSVPQDRRSEPLFQKAIDKFTHAVVCRELWNYRFGLRSESPATVFPEDMKIDQLPGLLDHVYGLFDQFMSSLNDETVASNIEYTSLEGDRHNDRIEDILVHLRGHMMYHRGQVATLVSLCGGQAVDTDYFNWIHRFEARK